MNRQMLCTFMLVLLSFASVATGWAQTSQGVVSGQVVFDGTGDAVAGAEILLLGNGETFYTSTDSDGRYSQSVPAGIYIAGVRLISQEENQTTAYLEYYDNVATLSEAAILTVETGAEVGDINFSVPDLPGLVSAGTTITITGTVTDADTGLPVNGATIMINDFKGTVIEPDSSTTDAQGRYTATVPGYVQRLKAWTFAPGYNIQFYQNQPSLQTATEILVDPQDPTITGIDFVLESRTGGGGGHLQGRVTDENEVGLSEALVVALHAETDEVRYALTNQIGTYDLSGLEGGMYYVLFLAAGYVPEYFGDVRTWTEATLVAVTTTTTDINARLGGLNRPPIGSGTRLLDADDILLTGMTLQASGLASANTLITILDAEDRVIGFDLSDDQGAYEINDLVPGDFVVHADRVGFNREVLNVSLEDTGTFAQTFARFALTPEGASTDIDPGQETPDRFFLEQNYPNPFNPATTIRYTLPQSSQVRLVIYDMLGREVATLVDEQQAAGAQAVRFQPPAHLASGPYYYRLTADGTDETRPMLLLK